MVSRNQSHDIKGKSVTLSVRISQEDAQFLSQYKSEGKITPSDKLRALIRETRETQEGLQDFRASIDMFEKMLGPINAKIRDAEMKQRIHSELVTRIITWLPDMMALAVNAGNKLEQNPGSEALISFEEDLVDRVFRLVETILQMGITEKISCYKSNAISSRVEPALDLFEIIQNRRK